MKVCPVQLAGQDNNRDFCKNLYSNAFKYDIKESGLLLQPKLILSPEDAFEIEMGVTLYCCSLSKNRSIHPYIASPVRAKQVSPRHRLG